MLPNFLQCNTIIRSIKQEAYNTGADPGFFPRGGPVGHRHIAHRDATGVSGEGTEGGLGGLPQENLEYEVL